MKGLLIKDCKLLLQQKKFLIMLVLCAGFLMFNTEDSTFLIGYATMLMGIFVMGTISYDEFDNGYPFLFSLPISRREYVLSKYVLCIASTLSAGIVATVLSVLLGNLGAESANLGDSIMAGMIIIAVCTMIIVIYIPVMMKYGSEKSKIAMFVLAAVAGGIGVICTKLQEFLSIDMTPLASALSNLGNAGLTLLAVVGCVVMTGISFGICVRIMMKKEF